MAKQENKNPVDSFAEMFEAFGIAMGKVFDDPELKEKAREFGKAASDSASTLGNRFKDEEVQAKFKEMGKAAEEFGKSVVDMFKDKK
jgi:ribosomal-protein-alanine N-acetyltransferase